MNSPATIQASSAVFRHWFLAARPKTLSAAVVPVIIGSALAAREPAGVIPWVLASALAGALLIQIATNFINDALDFQKGADTAERLGPLRATQAGLIEPESLMRGASVFLIAAALCGIPLIVRGGWPILIIGLTSLLAAYAYTGGPYPLAYHGWGEIFVLVFFGFVAVGGTFYAHTLQLNPSALIAGFAVGSLATVLIVINNLRDVATDRTSRKRTLAVRFGERFARCEVVLFALAPFVAIVLLALLREQWGLLAVAFSLPISVRVVFCTSREKGRGLNRCLALAGALQWAFGLLFVIGALI